MSHSDEIYRVSVSILINSCGQATAVITTALAGKKTWVNGPSIVEQPQTIYN